MRSITLSMLIMVCLFGALPPAHAQGEADLLRRVNDLRASLGLAPYQMNGALSAAAARHAGWMASTGEVSHTQPDGSTPRTRAAAAGYSSQWVSENIYGGTGATADTAWSFWVNSSVHYRGMTNPNYQDIGIGIVRGEALTAYVLVFGNSSGEWGSGQRLASAGSANSGGAQNANAAPPPPPSFVVGVDAYGNIMHEIQPNDTVGDIALLYGYTWDDIPYMMQINELDDITVRELKIGSVFLVPPRDGTYTPTPAPHTATPEAPTVTATSTHTPPPTATPVSRLAATAADIAFTETDTPTAVVTATATPQAVAEAAAQAPPTPTRSVITPDNRSPWLLVAIGLQVVLVLGAGIELVLRRFRR